MLPKHYTVAQVAEYFQRDVQTVRRWIAEGKFPRAYKVADGWFILESDILAFQRKHRATSGECPHTAPVKKRSGFVKDW